MIYFKQKYWLLKNMIFFIDQHNVKCTYVPSGLLLYQKTTNSQIQQYRTTVTTLKK